MAPEISARSPASGGDPSDLPGLLGRARVRDRGRRPRPSRRRGVDRGDRRDPAAGAGPRAAGNVYAMRNVLNLVPASRTLAESEPLTRLTRAVLGPGAFVVRGLLFDKTPEANWGVPWHQDLTIAVKARTEAAGYGPWTVKAGIPHVQPPVAVLEQMLTVRVHLDESDEPRGPLRVIRARTRPAA